MRSPENTNMSMIGKNMIGKIDSNLGINLIDDGSFMLNQFHFVPPYGICLNVKLILRPDGALTECLYLFWKLPSGIR